MITTANNKNHRNKIKQEDYNYKIMKSRKEKQLSGYIKRQAKEIAHDMTWTWFKL